MTKNLATKQFGLSQIWLEDARFYFQKFYQRDNETAGKSKGIIFRALLFPEYRVIFRYRIYSKLYSSDSILKKKAAMVLYLSTKVKYSTDIHPNAKIGVPFRIGHHMGIVIGPEVVVGRHCYVFNGVTLGNKNVGVTEYSMPKVGDNVLISTGCKVLGNITIGANSILAANSVVTKTVGSNEVWGGVPARFIKANEVIPEVVKSTSGCK